MNKNYFSFSNQRNFIMKKIFFLSFLLIISYLMTNAQTNPADKVRKNELSINILPVGRMLLSNTSSTVGETFGIYRHFYTRDALRIGIMGYSNNSDDLSKRYFVVKDSSFEIHTPNTTRGYGGLFVGWERHNKNFDLNKWDIYYGVDAFGKIGDIRAFDGMETYKSNKDGVYQLVPNMTKLDYKPVEKTIFYEGGASILSGLRVPIKKRSVFGFEAALSLGLLRENNITLKTNATSFNFDTKLRILYGLRF